MSWLFLGLISVCFLGLYDLCKKYSVNANAVLPVLFFSTLAGSIPTLGPLALHFIHPSLALAWNMDIGSLNARQTLGIFAKACIVSGSWFCSYLALKHLDLSVASPIRASQPIWTLIGAFCFFHESPSTLQMIGLFIVLGSYFSMALAHRKLESTLPIKWASLMLFAALLAAGSGFLDKILLQEQQISAWTMQSYFNGFLLLILGSAYLIDHLKNRTRKSAFEWRWSIPLIGLLLFAADMAYFSALNQEGALLSVLSPLRRGNAVISFIAGIFLLKESVNWQKGVSVAGIACGICLLLLGGT